MDTIYGKARIYFGTGYNKRLPEGWKLKESPEDWALGVAPDGEEYYLSDDAAYPRMANGWVDFYNGVISLANSQGRASRSD